MSTTDEAELLVSARLAMAQVINTDPKERPDLEKEHGQVWDTDELGRDFKVEGFAMPLVVVRRKSDNALGSLFFQSQPRYYFWWEAHEPEKN